MKLNYKQINQIKAEAESLAGVCHTDARAKKLCGLVAQLCDVLTTQKAEPEASGQNPSGNKL